MIHSAFVYTGFLCRLACDQTGFDWSYQVASSRPRYELLLSASQQQAFKVSRNRKGLFWISGELLSLLLDSCVHGIHKCFIKACFHFWFLTVEHRMSLLALIRKQRDSGIAFISFNCTNSSHSLTKCDFLIVRNAVTTTGSNWNTFAVKTTIWLFHLNLFYLFYSDMASNCRQQC